MISAVRFIPLILSLVTAFPAMALAAPVPASPSPPARAAIMRPLTMLKIADLDFAGLAVTTGGTATISPTTGLMTVSPGLMRLTGTPSPARFRGAASRLAIVLIRIPGTVAIRRVGGTQTLIVDQFTLSGGAIRIVGTTPFDFAVGARLTVPVGTVEGTYTGQMNVTIEYF